ncbi:MAG: hypothetical protein ACQEQE_10935 [Bacillota bacterium]
MIQEVSNISKLSYKLKTKIYNFFKNNKISPIIIFENIDKKNTKLVMIISKNYMYLLKESNNKITEYKINFQDIYMLNITIKNDHSIFKISSKYFHENIFFDYKKDKLIFQLIQKIRFFKKRKTTPLDKFNNLNHLKNKNLKLYNFSKYALSTNNEIIDLIYQKSDRKLNINSFVSILTNNELLFIKELDYNEMPKKSILGGNWSYIFLNSIKKIKLNNKSKDLTFDFKIVLKNNYTFKTKCSKNIIKSFKKFNNKIK